VSSSPGRANDGDAGRRKRTELRCTETHARRDDDITSSSIATARANVRAHLYRLANFNLVVTVDNILEGEDGVGSFGDDAAGRDLHRLALHECTRRWTACGDPLNHGQRAGQVGSVHGEPVHRRARERGQVDERADGLGRDAAHRFPDGHVLCAEHLRPGEHERLRLLQCE
jgi:hypothetical protein